MLLSLFLIRYHTGMIVRQLQPQERAAYNAVVRHPLQTWEWGEFRKKTGVEIERLGLFDQGKMVNGLQVGFHRIPHTALTAGYLPKGPMPDEDQLQALMDLGKKHNALYIKLEPNLGAPVTSPSAHEAIAQFLLDHACVRGRGLFSQHTFMLDLTPNEEYLLENMKQKTRYNIRLAERKGVRIIEDSTEQGLEAYLQLLHETTRRQAFYAHNDQYFRDMWAELAPAGIAHILKAEYEGKILAVWIVFLHQGVLYYPYGASSSEHKELMASNLLMWEAIKFGKRNNCSSFDMWGSLGPDASEKDPWFGFHKFKEGYGGVLTKFIGSFDLVLNPPMYKIYRILENWRWKLLRIKARLAHLL